MAKQRSSRGSNRRGRDTGANEPRVQQKIKISSVISGSTIGYNPNVPVREIESKLLAFSYSNEDAVVLPILDMIDWSPKLDSLSREITGRLRNNGGYR